MKDTEILKGALYPFISHLIGFLLLWRNLSFSSITQNYVFNNGELDFIELEQKSTSFVPIGTELNNPDFAAVAEAVGIRGIRLENPADIEPGITAAFAHDGPVLIDAAVTGWSWRCRSRSTSKWRRGFRSI